MTPLGNAYISHFSKTDFLKKEFFAREIFFLFANLFITSIIVTLHLNYLIHYQKRCVNHYSTGVISGHKALALTEM